MSAETRVSVSALAQFFFERSLSRTGAVVRKMDEHAVQLSLQVVSQIPEGRREKTVKDFEIAIGLIHELQALSVGSSADRLKQLIEEKSGEIARLGN